ncbi:DUF4232 domain-containing protein [Pseudarthrobacter sp. NPDC092424]|uniref:DUF4232 domain-containing protein n=1 Tax=Pseudarthrobacter sp. NPDC092424 TaxID=3364415 RepID=UPI00381AABCA
MATAVAAAALVLAGCGPSQPQQSATSPGTGSASPAPNGTDSASPSGSATPDASGAPSSTAAGSPALCKAEGLSAATDATGGGAAGSVYMKLMLTNKGTEPCLLRGFPGVSLVADATGAPIGAPASRDNTAAPVDVLLAPGKSGTAVLRYTQARNYMECKLADAAGYRIYPPEDKGSLFLAQPTKACTNTDITLLSVGAFQPS